jgi:hypothetical protein
MCQPWPRRVYDPQDFHNQEYRAYIGYVQGGVQYLGLPANSSITIRVPLVFWDAENTYIATDGKDLIPANPSTDSNPFRYDPNSARGVSLSTDTNSWVTQYSGPGAGLVMFYYASQPLTPSLDSPAQLTEFTIRDPYLNTGGTAPDNGWLTDDAQTSVLFNYDVSYVDNLTSSIAMEARQVPIPIALNPNPPTQDFGWAGSSLIYGTPTTTGTMQNLINDFITNTGAASIGQYFGPGGAGWPSYFNPDGILKIPGGANIFANSPLNGQLSSYFTNGPNNQYMLSSGGTGPIMASAGGDPLQNAHPTQLPLSLATDQRAAFVKNLQLMLSNHQEVDFSISPDPTLLGKVDSYDPRAGLTSISVTNGGSGYNKNTPPMVVISGGGGSGATGIAFVSDAGVITGVGLTKPGSGYTMPPTISFIGAPGSGAVATATIGGGTASVTLNPGVSLPTNTPLSYVFTRPATDYAATAILNLWYSWAQYYVNQFTTFQPPAPIGGGIAADSNVLILDNVPASLAVGMTVSGPGVAPAPGTSVSILAIAQNGVKSINVTNGGSGYNPKAPPIVSITGGGGSGASAIAVVSDAGVVTGVTIVNAGSGYTSPPTVSFSGGGSGATATASVGTLIYLSQLSSGGGSGTYTFAAPQALPFANSDGVKSILVTNQGSGYNPDAPPTVDITNGGGSGATAKAIVSKDGHVTAIAIINAGSGYTSPPTVSFSNAGGGSGAVATASVGTFVTPLNLTFTQDQQQTALRFAGSVYEAMAAEAGILTYPTRSPLLPPSMSLVYTTLGTDTADLPNSNGGASLVGAQVRDLIKSILRGVYDFQQVPDESQWYPNPATWQGGQNFNVYNLDPYVWFVHRVLKLSGYGFSVDDDTADVSAAASNYTPVAQRVLPNNLQMIFSGLGNLTNSQEWFPSVNWGTVTDQGTISNPTTGPYAGKSIITLTTESTYWQISNPDPKQGQVGAYVSGPGIPPGTVVAGQGDVKALILILANHVPDSAGAVQLTFSGKPPANPIGNSGFEMPDIPQAPPGNQSYNPPAAPWVFSTNQDSGIAGNGSSLTALNGPAPEGTQVAFVQNQGSVSQTLDVQAGGTYILSFDAAQRQNGQNVDHQTLAILVDGKKVGEVTPSGANYTAYSFSFLVTAGTHTLTIGGTATPGTGATAFIDTVGLTVKLQ